MTRDEIKRLLMTIKNAFPNAKIEADTDMVDVWEATIGDLEFIEAAAALKAYIQQDTTGFAPTIGQLRGKRYDLIASKDMTAEEAWSYVVKAVRNSAYNAEEEFAKLPNDRTRRAVGGVERLSSLAMSEDGLDYAHAAFVRAYNGEAQRDKERGQMSPDLIAFVDRTMARLEGRSAALIEGKVGNGGQT